MARNTRTTERFNSATFDFPMLIALLGGDARVSRLIDKYGFKPASADIIQQWKVRGSIPNKRFAELCAIAKEQTDFDWSSLLRTSK